jgi:pimeloyl-ACP methyl ester carboxylesterase
MNAALSSVNNGTIVRLPTGAMVRTYFALLSRLLPALARRQAERWFTRPPRYAGRRSHPVAARRETVVAGRHRLAVWQAGAAAAPAVLLCHGWGGSSVQMGSFVAPLLARGFRVVWFDQPGHGESGRGQVALPDLVAAIAALAETHGPFEMAVGHSLGAAAIGLALRRGLSLRRVAFVSPPASMIEHTHNFARLLGITPRIREAMRARVERRYGIHFADIDRLDELRALNLPALFVHDAGDTVVPFEHSQRLSMYLANARTIRTEGLGHFRILRDAGVVAAIADFAAGKGDALPEILPALPLPAPIY